MQVTFTGIKNVGFIKIATNNSNTHVAKQDSENMKKFYKAVRTQYLRHEWYLLNMQLTDDFNGKHHTEFQQALQKSGLSFSRFKNPIDKDFLNILFKRDFCCENGENFNKTIFEVNNHELILENEKLPLFSYLARTIREIAQKPEQKFVVNENYLTSYILSRGMVLGEDLKKIFGKNYYDEAKRMHEPLEVKNCAQKMDDIMHMEMMDYFNR